MDEILVSNFMVFHDLVDEEAYDLWVADEGWDVDAFLHDNPELKRAPYAWLTDFVGWLPMPDGGALEASRTTDWNAEHVDRILRYPRLRDRALFVGDPEDAVGDSLGPGLPTVAEWTAQRYACVGYVTGRPLAAGREELRAELGWRPDERVCVVAVGGSDTGRHLLRRVAEAAPTLARRIPGLRTVLVAGPRIDPAALPAGPGVEVLGYVPDLRRQLSACDVAVVQGGLTTTMELTAAGVPFLYVPLEHHFEQQIHVPHRLARHGAGERVEYAEVTDPERLADALARVLGRPVSYRPVDTGGAARAAEALADLL
jgi:predicted glycosyltransferase